MFDCAGNSSGAAVAADDQQTLQKLQKLSLWNFGKDICSAAYKQAEGAPVSYVNQRYGQAKKIADILGALLPPLPPREGNKLKDKIFANKYLVVDLKPFYAALDQSLQKDSGRNGTIRLYGKRHFRCPARMQKKQLSPDGESIAASYCQP